MQTGRIIAIIRRLWNPKCLVSCLPKIFHIKATPVRLFRVTLCDYLNITSKNYEIASLPTTYTLVQPTPHIDRKLLKITRLLPALNNSSEVFEEALTLERVWLSVVEAAVETNIVDENLHWASFHANINRDVINPCKTALLPMFHEKAATTSMMNHALHITKEITNYLNKDQTPVITCDEPLFAIIKELQWAYPEKYGCCHGRSSSRNDYTEMLSGTHVTKCRYAHQVTCAALYILRRKAFLKEGFPDTPASFTEWDKKKQEESPTYAFWLNVYNIQQILLLYVRSIREGNLQLYIAALEQAVLWYFALDHSKYSKWTVVHLQDMRKLETKFPEIYREFLKGKIVAKKSKNPFSAIALDHAHEQENDIIKGVGGAKGLTDNPSAFRRWMITGPEIASLIYSFEEKYIPSNEAKETIRDRELGPKTKL